MSNPGTYTKAILTAVAAGVGPYLQAVGDTSQYGTRVSLGEWLTIGAAILVGSVAVWRVDNVRWFTKAKAYTGAAAQLLGQLAVLLLAGRTPTVPDVVQALLAVGITYGVVWVAPNASASEWHDPAGGDGEDEPDDPADPEGVAALEPLDKNDDGRDDRTGRILPGGLHFARLAIPGGALALILGGGLAAALPVAADAATTNTVCAAGSRSLQYATNVYVDSPTWKSFPSGSCVTNDANNGYRTKTSGGSIAAISGLYGVKCSEARFIQVSVSSGSRVNVAGYAKDGCRN